MKTCLIAITLLICSQGLVAQDGADTSRAAWLLAQADVADARYAAAQQEIGGEIGGGDPRYEGAGTGVLKPMILSALIPGLGEATMGYRRGYVMIAADLASWFGIRHYHRKGGNLKRDYIDYADVHWSLDRLDSHFIPGDNDAAGNFYYGVEDHEDLSLWVSQEDDFREYYENLGKWDQFVFGWDDFVDPRGEVGVDVATSVHLKDNEYGVSGHRMIYRDMRKAANSQFDNRDRLVYLNMFTRVFSMFQVAYLSGVFSDGQASAMTIGGYDVAVLAEPRGFTGGRLGFAVSY